MKVSLNKFLNNWRGRDWLYFHMTERIKDIFFLIFRFCRDTHNKFSFMKPRDQYVPSPPWISIIRRALAWVPEKIFTGSETKLSKWRLWSVLRMITYKDLKSNWNKMRKTKRTCKDHDVGPSQENGPTPVLSLSPFVKVFFFPYDSVFSGNHIVKHTKHISPFEEL